MGRAIVERLDGVVSARDLAWQKLFRKGYVAYQRAGGYNVVLVDLWWRSVPRLAIKIPCAPAELSLASPYPGLADSWNAGENEWGWTVPSIDLTPDVTAAVTLVAPYHPDAGPMIAPGSFPATAA